jgi:hypothetical protein
LYKKGRILSFAATWIELEVIMLSKLDIERQRLHDLTQIVNVKKPDLIKVENTIAATKDWGK